MSSRISYILSTPKVIEHGVERVYRVANVDNIMDVFKEEKYGDTHLPLQVLAFGDSKIYEDKSEAYDEAIRLFVTNNPDKRHYLQYCIYTVKVENVFPVMSKTDAQQQVDDFYKNLSLLAM